MCRIPRHLLRPSWGPPFIHLFSLLLSSAFLGGNLISNVTRNAEGNKCKSLGLSYYTHGHTRTHNRRHIQVYMNPTYNIYETTIHIQNIQTQQTIHKPDAYSLPTILPENVKGAPFLLILPVPWLPLLSHTPASPVVQDPS